MPGFEYRRAIWDEVQAPGPQGWRLVAIPPIQEVRNVLGAAQVSEPMFTMERDTSAAYDQAVARVAALRTGHPLLPGAPVDQQPQEPDADLATPGVVPQ